MDGLERLVAQCAQAFAIFAVGLEHVEIHAHFGPDEKGTPMLDHPP